MLNFLPDPQSLQSGLDTASIFQAGEQFARLIAVTITPTLLVVMLWFRVAREQLETVTSGGSRWGQFAREMAVWLPVLGLYFTLATEINELFNTLYRYFYNWGSADAVNRALLAKLKPQSTSLLASLGPVKLVLEVGLLPFKFVYYCSLLASTLCGALLQIMHALCYCLALCWGLIVIPLALGGNLSLLGSWGRMCGLVLLWPLVHYTVHRLSQPMFEQLLDSLMEGGIGDSMEFYLVMTLVNLCGCALLIAAPRITQVLLGSAAFASAGPGAMRLAGPVSAAAGTFANRLTSRFGPSSGSSRRTFSEREP